MLSQLIKFSLVGLVNTAIHFAVFMWLYQYLNVYHLIASTAGFILAVMNSYLLNKMWTFKVSGTLVRHEFSRFFLVSLIALLVNLVSMALLVEVLTVYPPLAQLMTIVLTLLVNFSGNKFWAFRVR